MPCTVDFVAGVVSGIATINGEVVNIDQTPFSPLITDTQMMDIGLVMAPAANLFSRSGERSRGGTSQHSNAVAYSLDPRVLGRANELRAEWEKETGTYFSVNDLCLPRGGLFDIVGDWRNSHNSHRLGTSIDVEFV